MSADADLTYKEALLMVLSNKPLSRDARLAESILAEQFHFKCIPDGSTGYIHSERCRRKPRG